MDKAWNVNIFKYVKDYELNQDVELYSKTSKSQSTFYHVSVQISRFTNLKSKKKKKKHMRNTRGLKIMYR